MGIRLYLAAPFAPHKPSIRIVRTHATQGGDLEPLLFKGLPSDWDLSAITFTSQLEEADAVLVPQAMKRPSEVWNRYFESVYTQAQNVGKPTYLFIGGDLAHKTHVRREYVVAFKGTEYRKSIEPNEIIFPGYVEDLGEGREVSIRKKSAKPIVGFCGYAGFPNTKTIVRYLVKNVLLDVLAFMTHNPQHLVYKRGIFFRRWAMEVLSHDARVKTNFIIRDSFGGNAATTKVDPTQARAEYIQNMLDSDFVLAPKGDGNYSARFYEALSLGRIPILIDTDMVLPLENALDYSKFILRVPHTEVHRLGEIVHDFYATLTDESFANMQRAARKAFAEHLRYDRFFAEVLPALKATMPPNAA
ncbi:MAG: exostosin family protein [Candidatus Pacebacteria bacterium]|nr:exostosin family protein [Candidatus Paceibacterota bacterium]